jgi:hypothetical protein
LWLIVSRCSPIPEPVAAPAVPTPTPSMTLTSIPTSTKAPTPTLAFTAASTPTQTPEATVSNPLVLQEGNPFPKYAFVPKPSSELENNRMGAMWLIARGLNLNFMKQVNCENGLKWTKVSKDWFDGEELQEYGGYSQFDVSHLQDQVIDMFNQNEIAVMYTLVYWDETLHVGENYPRYRKEEEIQRYLDYVEFIVRHFKGRIKYYEILNEPINGPPQQHVEVADYINLIRRVVPVIRQEDPAAKIVVSGATYLRQERCRNYLFEILRSDVMPLIDVISTHPMYGASPEYDELRQYYYFYPTLAQEIKKTAYAHGFLGEYFADDMSWRTYINARPEEPWVYTSSAAAKYYARGIVMNLGLGFWAGFGGEKWQRIEPVVTVVKNLSTAMAGASTTDLPREILSETKRIASYTFEYSNRDLLLALWDDGPAVFNHPGATTTLTLPGMAGYTATVTDLINSFQQQLETSEVEGDLVISDLLVRDYPLMIRLSRNTSP